MDLELELAGPERVEQFEALLELYMRELSPWFDLKPDPDGRYRYAHLPDYWREPGHYPFLLGPGPLGFALVRQGSRLRPDASGWDMAEFFIAPDRRGRGLGEQAADALWQRFRGCWDVRVLASNQPALRFWRRSIEAYKAQPAQPEPYRLGDRDWLLFRFES